MERSGIKINGSAKLIGFIILIVGSTVSVVASIEGMRGDIRVNTKEIELMREDMIRLEGRVNEHIEEDR
jgi:hypothetical protein